MVDILTPEQRAITDKILAEWDNTPEAEKHTPLDELADKVLKLAEKNNDKMGFKHLILFHDAACDLAHAVYNTLPSQHQIGDNVVMIFGPNKEMGAFSINGHVTGVHFYAGKVKYDLQLRVNEDTSTRVYNIDSVFVLKP